MRIEQVVAHAFGPIDEKTLPLAPGMTVVYGPNEAGKSSWHAALYAGLCGVRRGKGQPLIVDRELRDDHKPWDGERWDVEVVVQLADDRRIEIRQDLAGRVDSRATDLSLGTDVSGEIMVDGSPDGSKWLGLDRRAFLATACIGQTELLAIANDPDLLQEYIQRAAATRGTDATAAAAIDRLDEFRRAHVGEDRANSTKPLRQARVAAEAATTGLAGTRQRHAEYLELVGAADAARGRADLAEADVRPLVAAVTAHRATAARRNAERAAELAANYPDGAPTGIVARDELSDRAAAALEGWDRRPPAVALDGESAEALGLRLARLPAVPTGDLSPADEVIRARTAYDRRVEALQLVGERPTPASPATAEAADRISDRDRGLQRRSLGVAAIALGVVGLAVALVGPSVVGIALLVVAGLIGLAALFALRGGGGPSRPPVEVASTDGDRLAEWERLRAERQTAVTEAEATLRTLLEAHGTVVGGDAIDGAYDRYLADCRTRATLAGEASGAATLQAAIAARRGLEQTALDVDQGRARIVADLQRAAADAGVVSSTDDLSATDPAALADGLRAWQTRRAAANAADETALREWQELETILAGRPLDDIRAEADRLAVRAADTARGLDPAVIANLDPGADPEARIAGLESEANAARADADRTAGQLAEVERGLPSVAEAEERLAAAESELARVTGLDQVLQTTLGFLRQAEERIHRDLAPVLGAAISARLPRISAGRYIEATVNPADLAVRVKAADDGRWREARRLSHGTREQIYLLLRLAMTEHLVTPGEVAPLICDEVTVQSDQVRAFELLDLLHETSAERQVVVFTHDERALAWAEASLTDGADRLQRLTPAKGSV